MIKSILFKNPHEMMDHILNINKNYELYNIAVKLIARKKTTWYPSSEVQIDDINLYLHQHGKSTHYFPFSLIEEVDVRYKKIGENNIPLRFEEHLRTDDIYLDLLINSTTLDKLNLLEHRLKIPYK